MFKNTVTVLEGNKYTHIRTRINNIRDLAIEISTEIVRASKELRAAVKENPEDFKELQGFTAMAEAEMLPLKNIWDNVEAKIEEHLVASAESTKAVKSWLKESPMYDTFDVEVEGPVVNVTVAEYSQVLRKVFCAQEGGEILHDVLREGNSVEMAGKVLEERTNAFIQSKLLTTIPLVNATGRDAVKFNGVRYIIS